MPPLHFDIDDLVDVLSNLLNVFHLLFAKVVVLCNNLHQSVSPDSFQVRLIRAIFNFLYCALGMKVVLWNVEGLLIFFFFIFFLLFSFEFFLQIFVHSVNRSDTCIFDNIFYFLAQIVLENVVSH